VKDTVLDPVYRYHTSVISDPFEILGIEKPQVNLAVRSTLAHLSGVSTGAAAQRSRCMAVIAATIAKTRDASVKYFICNSSDRFVFLTQRKWKRRFTLLILI